MTKSTLAPGIWPCVPLASLLLLDCSHQKEKAYLNTTYEGYVLSAVLLALLLGDLLFAQAKCGGDVADGVPDCVERDENPEHVEEEQVDPKVHEVAAVKVDVADEPLRAKGHEACYNVNP